MLSTHCSIIILYYATKNSYGTTRLTMLETIREYAVERQAESGETNPIQNAYVDYYTRLVETAYSALHGAEQRTWLNRLESDHANMRAILTATRDSGAIEANLRLAVSLVRFWQIRGYWTEGVQWLDEALAQASDTLPLQLKAMALNCAAHLNRKLCRYVRAKELYMAGGALAQEIGDTYGMARALNGLAILLFNQGQYSEFETIFGQCLSLFEQLGNEHHCATALTNIGAAAGVQGAFSRARQCCEESLRLFRKLGSKQGIAKALSELGEVARNQEDYIQAESAYAESLTLRRELEDRGGIAVTLLNMGWVALAHGQWCTAAERLTESLALLEILGDKRNIAECLIAFASLALAQEQPIAGARVFSAAETLRETLHIAIVPTDRPRYEGILRAVRERLDAAAIALSRAEGRAMPLDQAIAEAKTIAGVTFAASDSLGTPPACPPI